MATELDYARLRSDVGANDAALTDNEAAAIFAEAAEVYAGTATINAYARTITIARLLASSAKLVDYAQDTTTEKMSQVFDHLHKLLDLWEDKLAAAIAAEVATRGGGARFGGKRTKPARVQEWPNARL